MTSIKKVGVVGCGLMGSGIAQVCAEAGYDVIVREVSDELLKKGLGKIDSFLAKGVEKGKVKPERKAEVMGRLEGTTALDKLGGCDFVIEVVVENLAAKREVYQALDAACGPQTMNFDCWRHLKLAHFWQLLRRGDRAAAALEAALSCDPTCVQAAGELGHFYGSRGDYIRAAGYLERALALAPADPDTHFNLGFVRERSGHHEDAIGHFREAVRLRPSIDRAWYGMGLSLAALGRHGEAADALEEAARLQPMNPHAWYALGMAYHTLGRGDKVRATIERLRSFDPKMTAQLEQDASPRA